MKISYQWLSQYFHFDLSPEEAAKYLTSSGLEVEGIELYQSIRGGLRGLVIGEVLTCEPHPDSDHLHLTTVNVGGDTPLNVVCGAPNVAAGQKVLFARIGTVLPGDFKIKKSKIRGVESFGMICAEDELGIGDDHAGIMVLPEDAVIGTPAKEYLHLKTEAVIEYEITANRVDASSHIGVARDLYAWMVRNDIPCSFAYPSIEGWKEGEGKGLPIEVQDPTAAPRYCGITVKGVKVGPSPEWLRKKLLSIGLRPIDNVVDISNFILWELGQPLHTFDADKVKGGKVIVRRANEGEKIVTLDEQERKLSAEDIVIADAEGPMCIAGVFGGIDSGVTESTTNVFIESAYFDPGSIRKTSKRHTLQTDASFRFERGCDPSINGYACKRAAILIKEVAGGEIVGGMEEFYPVKIERCQIDLDYDRIESFIGKKIGHDTIESILESLNYEFLEKRPGGARVAAPTYMIDVTRECDVVEEILRIYGYNNIDLPRHMKMSVNATPTPEPEAIRNGISNFLAANGFVETMNNSLTKGAYYKGLTTYPEERCATIVNPLSSDLNVMRQTLLFNGLEVIAYNINRQIPSMRTFEYGSVYSRKPEGDGKTLDSYEEHPAFAMFITGAPEKTWNHQPGKSSFFELKGYLDLLLRRFGADLYQMETAPAPADIFSEGVAYSLPGQHIPLAVVGTVLPALARKFDVKQPVFAAEINWNTLFLLVKRDKVAFKELPRFPEVRRDLALLLDESVSYSDLYRSSFKAARKLLKSVTLFDVYRGDKIPAGKKQYALGFVLQDLEKTLTDADVERIMNKLLSTFQNEYGAALR